MTERTEQIVREAPQIEAYKLGLLESAKQLGNLGVQLPPQQIAQMTDLQQAALAQAGAGIGDYIPYMAQAGSTLGDAQRFMEGSFGKTSPYGLTRRKALGFFDKAFGVGSPYGTGRRAGIAQLEQAGRELPGTRQIFDPALGMRGYMDPYESKVVQQTMGDIQRQGDIARQQQRAQAVGAGAFGGSRGEIAEQELNRNILEQQARTAAQLRSAGWQQNLGAAQQGFEQAQQRAQQAAQLRAGFGSNLANIAQGAGQIGIAGTQALGQMAGQTGQLGIAGTEALGTLGLRQGALGELGQQLGQRGGQYLFEAGKLGQAQQQAELEALRQSQLAQLYEPYQRVGFLSDIYKGAPSSQMAITGATAPQASPAQQLLGLGIAGLSAYGGAQRAGLFGFGT
jgi:hypothetical protein